MCFSVSGSWQDNAKKDILFFLSMFILASLHNESIIRKIYITLQIVTDTTKYVIVVWSLETVVYVNLYPNISG